MEPKQKQRRLGKRPTELQKRYLVDFLERHKDLVFFKYIGPNDTKNRNFLWDCVAEELNAMGGAKKDVIKWRKYWIDMRHYTKERLAQTKEFAENELCEKFPRPLSDMEKRILALMRLHKDADEENFSDCYDDDLEIYTETMDVIEVNEDEEKGNNETDKTEIKSEIDSNPLSDVASENEGETNGPPDPWPAFSEKFPKEPTKEKNETSEMENLNFYDLEKLNIQYRRQKLKLMEEGIRLEKLKMKKIDKTNRFLKMLIRRLK